VFAGGHSPAANVVESTDGKQIELTAGSLMLSGELSFNRVMSLTNEF
jgi:hypothetical protein